MLGEKGASMSSERRSPNQIARHPIHALNLAKQGHASATIEHIVNEVFGLKVSLVLTHGPGPREPLFIDGKRLRDLMFWVPHPAKLGLGFGIPSYAGKVIVGVRVEEAVTKNPRRLVELFEEEASRM